MIRKILTVLVATLFITCAQVDPDQYKAGQAPVYGESNGWFYDATNDYLSGFINDVEVAYIDSSGNMTLDGSIAGQSLDPADDAATCFGTGDDFCLEFNAANATPDCAYIGVGTESNQLVIGEVADTTGAAAADLAIAQRTDPTLNIHSADATDTSDYILVYMDQTNGVIDVGQGMISLADNTWLTDDLGLFFGASSDGVLTFDKTGQAPDAMFLGVGQESRQLVIAETADIATDLTHAQSTDPKLVIHSADATTSTDWVALWFDQTNGVLDVGSGAVSIPDGITTAATTAAMTYTGTNATVVAKDNTDNTLCIGSAGATDALCLDSSDDSEEWIIIGYAGTDALSVEIGNASFDADVLVAGDLTCSGGAGTLTFDTGDETIVIKDADTTSLQIGSTGALDLVVFDSSDAAPLMKVKGVNGQTALHVDVGNLVADEGLTATGAAVLSSTVDANGVVSFGAGAGAITFDGATGTNTILCEDAVAAGLSIGATGATDLMVFTTTDASPLVKVKGVNGQTALHVDVGNFIADEGGTITGAAVLSSTVDANGVISCGAGAGAVTFDAASSSILTTDNAAAGLDIGATGATAMIRLDTQDNAENVLFGSGVKTTNIALTGVVALDGSDCGRWQMVTDAADGDTIDLPATIAGCELKFMFVGSDGGALIDISPDAADAVHGSCTLSASVLEFNGTDDNDIGLTKNTSNTGDTVSLLGDGTEGWYVTTCTGIWANN